MKRFIVLLVASFALFTWCGAQYDQKEIFEEGIRSLETFKEFLSIPNDANHLEDIEKNVDWCVAQLVMRSFTTQRWDTETTPLIKVDGPQFDAGKPTVLFYFHVDGQSVDPQYWFQASPYLAVLKELREGEGFVEIPWSTLSPAEYNPDWYIFARSASDSKNNFMQFLVAWDILKSKGVKIPYNVELILDFEEEKGSVSLPGAVARNKDKFKADMQVIFDGPRHVSNLPTLSFGARGIATMTLTVYGPTYAQHSGHYGNYAPNPALNLSKLLASMKDDDGRVIIPGYYDGIELSSEVEAILDAVPDDEKMIKAKLGIKSPDKVADTYQKSIQYPSLNIRGMSAGWVGSEARTIVPAQAVAELDLRLVKESEPERLIALVTDHIRNQGYYVSDEKPTMQERLTYDKICRVQSHRNYRAYRTEFDSEIGLWLDRAMALAFGYAPIKKRTSGGSIPISPFIEILEIPAVSVPMANPDNNQHSPNENIRLGNYLEGILAILYILDTPIDGGE